MTTQTTTQTYTTIRDLEQGVTEYAVSYAAQSGLDSDAIDTMSRTIARELWTDRAAQADVGAYVSRRMDSMSRAHTWYVVVMAGRWDSKLCRPIPRGPWGSEREAREALSGWMLRASQWASSEIARCSARLYQYPTREAARAADISDDVPGESLRGSSMLG